MRIYDLRHIISSHETIRIIDIADDKKKYTCEFCMIPIGIADCEIVDLYAENDTICIEMK